MAWCISGTDSAGTRQVHHPDHRIATGYESAENGLIQPFLRGQAGRRSGCVIVNCDFLLWLAVDDFVDNAFQGEVFFPEVDLVTVDEVIHVPDFF